MKKIPDRLWVDNMIYFDTSSINYFVDNYSINDCIATQRLQAHKKRIWCLSPVNLYEIFMNSSVERREEIIHRINILYYGKSSYFDIPTRILFGEVLGYTTKTLTEFEDLMKKMWLNIKTHPKNKEEDFRFDDEDFQKRRSLVNTIIKDTLKCLLKEDVINLSEKELLEILDTNENTVGIFMVKKICSRFNNDFLTKENLVKIFLIYMIFCFGVEPNNEFLEEFWKNKENFTKNNEVTRTLNRFISLLNDHEKILFNHPVIEEMTKFIIFEYNNPKKKIDRGTFSDALHLIYSFLCFYFVTDDNGLILYSKNSSWLNGRLLSVKEDFSFKRIYYWGKNPFKKISYWIKNFFQ